MFYCYNYENESPQVPIQNVFKGVVHFKKKKNFCW